MHPTCNVLLGGKQSSTAVRCDMVTCMASTNIILPGT